MTAAIATVPASRRAPGSPRVSFLVSTLQVARRALLRYFRTPQLVVVGSVQGALFLLIFRYVFGGAVSVHGTSYVNFLVPGFAMTGVLFTGQGAATGVAEDLSEGFVDRLRSLPAPRACFLSGRAVADTIWNSYGLFLAVAVAFEWLFIALGLVAGNAQAAQGMALLIFPLTFVSSAYVPVASMPGWLQAFAMHQPVTYMVDAVRALALGAGEASYTGHSASYFVGWSVVWALGTVAVLGPISAARYNRA